MGHPRAAATSGLELVEAFSFERSEFRGYEPRREIDDKTFPYDGARIHVLQASRTSKVGDASSQRDFASRWASFAINKKFWDQNRGHPFATTPDSVAF